MLVKVKTKVAIIGIKVNSRNPTIHTLMKA